MLEGETGVRVPAKGIFSPQLLSLGPHLCVPHRSEYHCVQDEGLHILELAQKGREMLAIF